MPPEVEPVTEPVEPVEPVVEPQPEPPTRTVEDLLAIEREARIRAETEARVLREQAASREPASSQPSDTVTAEMIEEAFSKGEINEGQRVQLHAKREARLESTRLLAERESQSRRERVVRGAQDKIGAYLQRVPDLQNANGPEMARVKPVLAQVADELDLKVEDPRAQAIALERVYGPLGGATVDAREFERRRRPVGAPGRPGYEPPPAPRTASKGERIFNLLLPEYQQFYTELRGSREAAYKTLEYADEAMFRKMGRFA